MKCDFVEKVSMLIDGELPAAEIEAVRAHVEACADCRELEKDFLFFRRQITNAASDYAETARVKTSPVAPEKRNPFWRRWISLPVPALALFVFALICAGAWLTFSRLSRMKIDTAATETPAKNGSPKTENSPDMVSLARYDGGGRAEIYVAPRQTR